MTISFVSSFLVQSLEMNSPWSERRPDKYVGWHIRTSHGETNTSWSPDVHKYILQESAEVICPAFETATEAVRMACHDPFADDIGIFISSTRYILRVLFLEVKMLLLYQHFANISTSWRHIHAGILSSWACLGIGLPFD